VPLAEKERALQRTLVYAVWPGSGNVADPAQIEPLRPLFKRSLPLFAALARAGWEPVTEAHAQPVPVVVERYGRPEPRAPVYLVVHNSASSPAEAKVHLTDGLAKKTWQPAVTDALSGRTFSLTGAGVRVPLAPWQTVMLELRQQ
ncbi:MAG: hypothetical protein GW867_11585, partial [Armatimonadetes bacterium]|nr:hypothetical protein [Armatimonadota bacterium]